MMKRIVVFSVFLIAVLFTTCKRFDDKDTLVPSTVDQNPSLPSMRIEVDGVKRLVHYHTFGDSSKPTLFIIHGSASDMRAYLPFQLFADKYFVVLWDMRGNGLSERCTKEELQIPKMVEEIHVMKAHFSPQKPINILGHSWSAFFTAAYLAKYPNEVNQAILLEPNPLKDTYMKASGNALNLYTKGFMDMMYTNKYLTAQNHEMLDYQALAMLTSAVRNFFCDKDHLPPWPVWRVGALALITWEESILVNNELKFDYTIGIENFPRKVLLVGSSCSPIGFEFQEKYHLPLFQQAEVLRIYGSGHRMITEKFDDLVIGLKKYLKEY